MSKTKLEQAPDRIDLKAMTKCEVGHVCHQLRMEIDRLQQNYQVAMVEYQSKVE